MQGRAAIRLTTTTIRTRTSFRTFSSSTTFDSTTMKTTTTTMVETTTSSLRKFEDVPRYAIYDSINETIGRTPIIRLKNMSPKEGVDVFVKLESENPGGSVKDRLALGVIEWAEKHGQLKSGQTGM